MIERIVLSRARNKFMVVEIWVTCSHCNGTGKNCSYCEFGLVQMDNRHEERCPTCGKLKEEVEE